MPPYQAIKTLPRPEDVNERTVFLIDRSLQKSLNSSKYLAIFWLSKKMQGGKFHPFTPIVITILRQLSHLISTYVDHIAHQSVGQENLHSPRSQVFDWTPWEPRKWRYNVTWCVNALFVHQSCKTENHNKTMHSWAKVCKQKVRTRYDPVGSFQFQELKISRNKVRSSWIVSFRRTYNSRNQGCEHNFLAAFQRQLHLMVSEIFVKICNNYEDLLHC